MSSAEVGSGASSIARALALPRYLLSDGRTSDFDSKNAAQVFVALRDPR